MRNKIKKLVLFELLLVLFITFVISKFLKYFELLTFFNLLLITCIICFCIYYFNKENYREITYSLLLTVVLMNWTIAITGLEYLVYEFDWNSFGIPINLNNDPNLYSADILSKQSFPHYWIYKLVSIFVETQYLNSLFFLGYILQNFFIAKTFLVLYSSALVKSVENKLLLFCILLVPMFYYPQISGHYTALPYFIPAILGYSLAVLNIANFIYKDKNNYEDYFFLFILIFVHPFWSIFVPLYLGICYLFSKEKKIKESLSFFILFTSSLLINNLDGVSILEIFNSSLISFYKSYVKIHFDWSAHIGMLFSNEINNFYQQSILLIFIFTLLVSRKIISLKTTEETFYTSLGMISVIIVVGNFFHSSLFNNFLIASNFYRIGSIGWAFIGVFLIRNIKNNKFLYFLAIVPLLFYIFSSQEVFKITIPSIPWLVFSSKYTLLLIAVSIYFFFLEKYKFSFLVAVIGFIYFTTFYFIDKVVTNNYLIKALTISFLIILGALVVSKARNVSSSLLPLLLILFSISNLFTENILLNFKSEYSTQISTQEIETIRKYTNNEDVILINPDIPHFRKETKRGVLIDYSLIPYSEEKYNIYKKYQNLFNNKFIQDLSKDEVLYVISNSNTTDLIIPNDSLSEEYFLKNFEYYKLPNLGYLVLNVNK